MSKNDPKNPTSWTPDFIAAFNAFRPAYTLPAGTYRVMDGKLYRVEPGLPPSLDTRDAEIASLRTRLAVAEAERDEQTEHADTLKRSDRQSLADYRKLRAQLDAAVERAEQAEAALVAANEAHARHAADRSREVTELHRAHERALRRAEQAEAERERVETFLNATWLTCWAKGVGDMPDREPPTDIEDAARDVSTFILGCNVQISELLAEVARLRGEYERALREAAGVLRDAARKHRSEAEASRSVAASGGHILAADILESYANMIDLLDAAPAAEVKP